MNPSHRSHRSVPTTPADRSARPDRTDRFVALGVLAHVDAGKTSLTEALLLAGGALSRLGRVDDGTTQTDSLALERRRGITIRTAVATFRAHGVTVNLVDTPGHPDFIAEVDRSLTVLDGAVLVVSAVEGVQAQTVVLHRALRRVGVPMIVFVNKTDRAGADPDRVEAQVRERLGLPPAGPALPVLRGSARTGAGVDALVTAVTDRLVPAAAPDPDAPVSGQVFSVAHVAGRRVCAVRLRAGTLRTRDRVPLGPGRVGTVTGLAVFVPGGSEPRTQAVAGEVVAVSGLATARVGDVLGDGGEAAAAPSFGPPPLQTTVLARDPAQADALRRALAQLADADPLIRVRPDARPGAVRIDVYGEVQQEVIAAMLEEEHGVLADFSVPVAACVERPAGPGAAVRRMGDPGHHRVVTLGVRVEPAPPGTGLQVVVEAARVTLPLHVYGTVDGLAAALTEAAAEALATGPEGWPVTDVLVRLVESDYPNAGPTPADVRHTCVTVVAEAVRRAGTVVCESVDRFRLEAPTDTLPGVFGLLAGHRAVPSTTVSAESSTDAATSVVEGEIPSGEVDAVRRGLPAAAHGLAVLESAFDHFAPTRRR